MSAGTGVQRVAAFLLSLEQQDAEKVLRSLPPDLLSEVVEAMSSIDGDLLQADNLNGLYVELARQVNSPRPVSAKSEDELSTMLEQTLGRDASGRVLKTIQERRHRERPFLRIEAAPAGTLAHALESESDAVVALVLAHMAPRLSAQVLGLFDPARSPAIVRRMATLIPPPFETLTGVAGALEAKLAEGGPAGQADASDKLRTIADLLNSAVGDLSKNVLDAIKAEDESMAEEIREFMFTWEDLATVDGRSMQKILSAVETKTLAMAIKGCSPAVEETVLGNLSSRVREMVADERELAGAVPLSVVEDARSEIMRAVRGLMESGEFQPANSGEELVS